MAIHPTEIAKPHNDDDWELWCKKIFAKHYGVPLQRFEVRGKNQEGIDLLAVATDGKAIGVQCKRRNRTKALTQREADSDLQRFRSFGVPLKAFAIATTHSSKGLQKWAAARSKRGFKVEFFAWGDIEDILRTDSSLRNELCGNPDLARIQQELRSPDRSKEYANYEHKYLQAIVRSLNKMNLYALQSSAAEVSEHPLTTAYVSVEVGDVEANPASDSAKGGVTTVEELMDRLRGRARFETFVSFKFLSDQASLDAQQIQPALAALEDSAVQTKLESPQTIARSFGSLSHRIKNVLGQSAATANWAGLVPRPRNLLLLLGEAGRGKTTILRYLAVKAAESLLAKCPSSTKPNSVEESPYPASWADRVPFFRSVRLAKESTPVNDVSSLVCDIAPPMPEQVPQGWTQAVLKSGRGLVLLDGVDEVPPGRDRVLLLEQIVNLVENNPETIFVVSSRPACVENVRRRLAATGFREARVQPLAGDKLREFIAHWHTAVTDVATKTLAGPVLEIRLANIADAAKSLPGELDEAPHIKAFAATPLLAALICAFHLERRYLPGNRNELMEALVESLVHRHDAFRPGMPRWPAWERVSEDDKVHVLSSIAAENGSGSKADHSLRSGRPERNSQIRQTCRAISQNFPEFRPN